MDAVCAVESSRPLVEATRATRPHICTGAIAPKVAVRHDQFAAVIGKCAGTSAPIAFKVAGIEGATVVGDHCIAVLGAGHAEFDLHRGPSAHIEAATTAR
ncbi:hypothetical protein D3C79_832900 [compost metagenome]